jgi:hypothetical protein
MDGRGGLLWAGEHGLSRLGSCGGLTALYPAVAGVSAACLGAAYQRLCEAGSACGLQCPAVWLARGSHCYDSPALRIADHKL